MITFHDYWKFDAQTYLLSDGRLSATSGLSDWLYLLRRNLCR